MLPGVGAGVQVNLVALRVRWKGGEEGAGYVRPLRMAGFRGRVFPNGSMRLPEPTPLDLFEGLAFGFGDAESDER